VDAVPGLEQDVSSLSEPTLYLSDSIRGVACIISFPAFKRQKAKHPHAGDPRMDINHTRRHKTSGQDGALYCLPWCV
jgi:hypothetical protein